MFFLNNVNQLSKQTLSWFKHLYVTVFDYAQKIYRPTFGFIYCCLTFCSWNAGLLKFEALCFLYSHVSTDSCSNLVDKYFRQVVNYWSRWPGVYQLRHDRLFVWVTTFNLITLYQFYHLLILFYSLLLLKCTITYVSVKPFLL